VLVEILKLRLFRLIKRSGVSESLPDKTSFMGSERFSSTEQGKGLVRFFLVLVGLMVLAVGGFKAVQVTYHFYDLKNFITHQLRTADIEPDSEIRKKVAARAKSSGVVCVEQDIVIHRGDGMITLEMPYRHDIDLKIFGQSRKLATLELREVVERRLAEPNKR
jgi:hypothetical protein